jgi:uncharacterized cupin superfamily protein
MIDMLVPSGSGPPRAGQTANIPSNAPHQFRNETDATVRLLCVASPSGLEEFFAAVGHPVATRTSPPPELTADEKHARMQKAIELGPKYHQEVLAPR